MSQLLDLDQDLFDKVFGKNSVKSVTEMKNKLSEDFVKQLQNQVDQKLMNDTIEYLIESTKINLPSEFLIKWMKLSSENKISIGEAKSEFEKSEKGMKYQLIESKLRNYFLPFVGEDSNAKSLSYKKFDKEWRQWRKSKD